MTATELSNSSPLNQLPFSKKDQKRKVMASLVLETVLLFSKK